jgi:hypothetical protein
MSDLETTLALEADLPPVQEAVAESGASLDRDGAEPGVFWLTMRTRTAPQETFFARIGWGSYPHAPPSIKFADAPGGRLDLSSAWPVIPGYRPGQLDICQPFTAEGHAIHPDWAAGPEAWRSAGNPFMWVILQLLHDIADRYQGRSA